MKILVLFLVALAAANAAPTFGCLENIVQSVDAQKENIGCAGQKAPEPVVKDCNTKQEEEKKEQPKPDCTDAQVKPVEQNKPCAEKQPEPKKCDEVKPEPKKCDEVKPEPKKCDEVKPEPKKCDEVKPEPKKCDEVIPKPKEEKKDCDQ